MAVTWQVLPTGSTTAPTTTAPNATAIPWYGNAPYDTVANVPGTFTSVEMINLELFVIARYNNPTFLRTITAGWTTGNQTINRPVGTVNIAAWAGSVVVTNSLVTANSIIFTTIRTADATLTSVKSVVAGAGSFTITGNATATAETSIWFMVTN